MVCHPLKQQEQAAPRLRLSAARFPWGNHSLPSLIPKYEGLGARRVCGLPLIHDKTVDEWGTAGFCQLMTGPPARFTQANQHVHPREPYYGWCVTPKTTGTRTRYARPASDQVPPQEPAIRAPEASKAAPKTAYPALCAPKYSETRLGPPAAYCSW